ncbi:helix-turn-helix domain-containing protein [Cylindrospermopsis curvispora]|uniref:Helix-turn-helix domain-containing protein n=1 Tax=Cylindrospermopsis curvispora GIHE-G1 TaxID=2666332 RepID=A0A7H0F5R3_9CYAN|nr:helix-turn-helix domain-containing protein [Cylindrospermopsis curvispora]QNP31379.1 helix-turn-helix domain-containing protein [Cylindrospermopsis curvispora GIHE-G1]
MKEKKDKSDKPKKPKSRSGAPEKKLTRGQKTVLIASLIKQGVTLRFIAKKLGCSLATVSGIAKELGYKFPTRTPEILSLLDQGFTQTEVAKKLGVSRQLVSAVAKRSQAKNDEEEQKETDTSNDP